jgi:hypothetical protein
MKKLIAFSFVVFALGFTSANAQSTTKKVEHDVKKGAKKAGNETAEVASKGAHHVVDKVYKGKEGPDGQTIYIDNRSRYFWIDEKGHKQYVTKEQLRDKPKD